MNYINFNEGFKAGKGDLVTEFSYTNGKSVEKTYREPVPATAFLTAKGNDFEVMIHKCSPGRKDYLIDPIWRTVARIKIQGVVADQIFKELKNDNPCLWRVRKKIQKDESGKDTEILRFVKVTNVMVKDVEKVMGIVAKACNLDPASSERIFTFMGKSHEVRETEERNLKAKNDRDELLKLVWTQQKISKASLRLVQDLALKEPTEKRNFIIRKAINGYYGDFTSPLAMPQDTLVSHLNEVGCPDLAQGVYNGRYDDDVGDIKDVLN